MMEEAGPIMPTKEAENDVLQGRELPPLGSLARCGADPLDYYPRLNNTSNQENGEIPDGELFKNEATEEMKLKFKKARCYGATFVVLKLFDRWLELGTRPSRPVIDNIAAVFSSNEMMLFDNELSRGTREISYTPLIKSMMDLVEQPLDNLGQLKELVNSTRRCLWKAAPDPSADPHLMEGPSNIPGAQKGLFAVTDIREQSICCYYSGDVHSTRSSQSATMLNDGSYLLRIGVLESHPWWYHTLKDAPDTVEDSCSGRSRCYTSLREEWDQLVGSAPLSSRDEIFVNPSNLHIKARYINDCLEERSHNVAFVMDPVMERAAIVALRDIKAGEELFVSYGQAYWDSMEATTGIVPRKLASSDQ